jgi:hypothetical protein
MANDRFASNYRISQMNKYVFTNVHKVSLPNMECEQLLNSRNLISTSQLGDYIVDEDSVNNLALVCHFKFVLRICLRLENELINVWTNRVCRLDEQSTL